jgi:hypothetical protein
MSFSASIASRRWREARLDLQVRRVYVGLAVLLQNKARKGAEEVRLDEGRRT